MTLFEIKEEKRVDDQVDPSQISVNILSKDENMEIKKSESQVAYIDYPIEFTEKETPVFEIEDVRDWPDRIKNYDISIQLLYKRCFEKHAYF